MAALPPGFFDRPFAHRGLHCEDRPENSLSAVKAAMARGYGIELDLQISSDGVAMVFHDDRLDRMTPATGLLRSQNGGDLSALVLNGGAGEGIPTLTEVLLTVSGKVPLLLELKDQDGALGPDLGSLERVTAQAVSHYRGPIALMSFNPHAVAMMATLVPDVPRGLTTCAFTPEDWPEVSEARRAAHRDMHLLHDVGATFVSHDVTHLTAPQVARVKAEGLPVACWTVRSPDVAQRALQIADCITFEGYLP